MGSEAEINELEYIDMDEFRPQNESTDYIQMNIYFCSFARVAYINNTSTYRLHGLAELDNVQSFCSAKDIVSDTILWIAVIFGIPGNIVALVTILTMARTTGTFYIALLSASDLIALCARASDALFFRHNLRYTSELCQFMQFLTNYSMTYSNWVLVFIGLERFITIRFPLKKSLYLTVQRACYSAVMLALVFLPIYLTFIFLTKADDGVCVIKPHMEYFYNKIFSHIVEALYSFIPAVLLFFFTIMVIIMLKKHQKSRKVLFGNKPCHSSSQQTSFSDSSSTHHSTSGGKWTSRKKRAQSDSIGRSITIMMMFATVMFLVLTIPLCVVYAIIIDKKEPRSTYVYARDEFMFKTIVSINLISHAINFYIYFLSTRKFRSHLHFLVMGRKSKTLTMPSLISRSTHEVVHH